MDLTTHVQKLKNALPSEDILTFSFPCGNKDAALIYADGIVDKELLGRLVVTPLASYTGKEDLPSVAKALAFPEIKENLSDEELISGILEGNPALVLDGEEGGIVVGTKKAPARAVTEPQTELVTHGPRAGFIEDAKTNMALLRLRFKTERLHFETVTIGKQSRSTVVLCYLDGIVHRPALSEIKKKLSEISIDIVPDSSYLAKFLCPSTFFRLSGMTEKPDILAARMAEGRIGIILDGSPVVLTLPYLLVESFQAPGDYFVNPIRATLSRLLRFFTVFLSVLLPAWYVGAQLFKLRLLPTGLLFTVAGGTKGLPLSPSLEILLSLIILELLTEASIRMPKYVALALSVVGALVLGETAVSAGILSTPAVILIAFSGIGLYTAPDLIETTSLLRIFLLIVAGSVGTYGIVLFSLCLFLAGVDEERFGVPLFAPFAPIFGSDLRDSLFKSRLSTLRTRPAALQSPNRTRMKGD